MANDIVQARIDPQLKSRAEEIFHGMGLKTSEAIRLFFQQCVNSNGLPFRPQLPKRPNVETIKAMQELENGGGEKSLTTGAFYQELGI